MDCKQQLTTRNTPPWRSHSASGSPMAYSSLQADYTIVGFSLSTIVVYIGCNRVQNFTPSLLVSYENEIL